MRKTLIILCACALLGIVAAYEVPGGGKVAGSTVSTTQSSQAAPANTPSAAANTSTPATAGYKNGTFTGSVASNPYDNIQVAVTIANGKITSVTTPTLTSEGGRSEEINSSAIPQLTQEVLASQNASIDGVSGASYTTQSYVESLQSALDQAKA